MRYRPKIARLHSAFCAAASLLLASAVVHAQAKSGQAKAEKLPLGRSATMAASRAADADLARLLGLADRNHPQIAEARGKLAYVRAQLGEARFAPFSQFRAVGGVSLAPTVRGSNVFSPNTDVSLTSSLGVAWRVSVTGVIPLWSFGKISNLWEAAEANVKVNRAAVEVARDAVRHDVRRAYFGLLLARDGAILLKDAEGKIGSALRKLQKAVDDDDGDPIDLLKLQTYSAELGARKAEATKFERVAIAGLRYYTGVTNLSVPDRRLERASHRLGSLQRYLRAARVYRPEVLMARAGIQARRAQVRLRRSQLFPDLGLGLSAGVSAAPEVANQINPFANDPGNFFIYGVAFVFQWKLDFVPAMYRVAQAEAQLQQMLALDRKALGGVAAEVEQAYEEVVDLDTRIKAYAKAERYARKWLATVQQSIDIGTMDDKDMTAPAKAWAQHRFTVLDLTMKYNMAIAKLAQVTGWDAIAPGGG